MEAHELCLDTSNLNYSLIRVNAVLPLLMPSWNCFLLHIAVTHENCMFRQSRSDLERSAEQRSQTSGVHPHHRADSSFGFNPHGIGSIPHPPTLAKGDYKYVSCFVLQPIITLKYRFSTSRVCYFSCANYGWRGVETRSRGPQSCRVFWPTRQIVALGPGIWHPQD